MPGEAEPLYPPLEEFASRFKQHSTDSIRNAYEVESSVKRSDVTGALSSSLAEDVVSLCYLQWNMLQEYCITTIIYDTPAGNELFREGMHHIARSVRLMHTCKLPLLWTSLSSCCRAANDFSRMADKLEVLWCKMCVQHPFLQAQNSSDDKTDPDDDDDDDDKTTAQQPGVADLAKEWNQLVNQLVCDAVASAERAQVFIMRDINRNTTIGSDFFSTAWERDLTHNEVMLQLIQLTDGYLSDIRSCLVNEHLWCKALLTTCKGIVCFYVRCLVEKADNVSRRRKNRDRLTQKGERKPFLVPNRALRRMWDDVNILRDFFLQKADGNPTLTRMLANEMYILEVIHECLDSDDEHSVESFIFVIHKRTGADALVTRHFLGDLWLLVAHKQGKVQIDKMVSMLQSDLRLVSSRIQEEAILLDKAKRNDMSFVRLDEMLRTMYEDRIAQGMLPACWACVPKKVEAEDKWFAIDIVRSFTRVFAELRWKKGF